jgi:hypothetical protein
VSVLQQIEVGCGEFGDEDLAAVHDVAELLARGGWSGATEPARVFFADLRAQLAGLLQFREELFWRLDASLSADDEGPEPTRISWPTRLGPGDPPAGRCER